MRVYFLGAGASKAFYPKLPLASELSLKGLLNTCTYVDIGQTPPASAIHTLTLFVAQSGITEEQQREPLENILYVFENHRYAYLNLQFCLAARLWIPDAADTSLLAAWLRCVRSSRDVIVTTNYDTVLERGIAKLTIDSRPIAKRELLNYGVRPNLLARGFEKLAADAVPGSITLLKLHGSISWNYCATCKKAALHPTYKNAANNALAGEYCGCGGDLSPILVGPANKNYDSPLIQCIFNQAGAALRRAQEVIFVGFSMNDGDQGIRRLVADAHVAAQTGRITIVDTLDKNDKHAAERAEQITRVYQVRPYYNLRMRYLMLAVLALVSAPAPAQNHDTRLMTPTEYKALLAQIDAELPIWEAALKKVDPGKANISYAVGKQSEDSKTLGLREAAWTREWAAKERVKHTVSGELGLEGFLRSLYDNLDSVNSIEAIAGMNPSGLEGYAPEISSLVMRISNDVAARVEQLEKGTCP